MENFRNYYEILGVPRDATAEDIKRGYRQLARQYHPDLNPGDQLAEERFKLLGEAYAVLSDPERRSQYESFSQFWNQKGFGQGQGRRSAKEREREFGGFRDFNSFVDQLLNHTRDTVGWGGAAAQPDPPTPSEPAPNRRSTAVATEPPPRPGQRDAEANLVIPLAKAYAGGRERIRLEDGRSLEVNMPAGMVTGQRIRLKGQGIGGGNLYLRIEVEPHPLFRLQGNDVICRLPLTPSEAALGGPIQVPTLDGWVRMGVPAGTQHGQRLRISGRGYPVGQQRGDQLFDVEIVIPSGLSDREKAIYEELRALESLAPRRDLAL